MFFYYSIVHIRNCIFVRSDGVTFEVSCKLEDSLAFKRVRFSKDLRI